MHRHHQRLRRVEAGFESRRAELGCAGILLLGPVASVRRDVEILDPARCPGDGLTARVRRPVYHPRSGCCRPIAKAHSRATNARFRAVWAEWVGTRTTSLRGPTGLHGETDATPNGRFSRSFLRSATTVFNTQLAWKASIPEYTRSRHRLGTRPPRTPGFSSREKARASPPQESSFATWQHGSSMAGSRRTTVGQVTATAANR